MNCTQHKTCMLNNLELNKNQPSSQQCIALGDVKMVYDSMKLSNVFFLQEKCSFFHKIFTVK